MRFLFPKVALLSMLAWLTVLMPAAAQDKTDRDAAYTLALPSYQYDAMQPLDARLIALQKQNGLRVQRFSYASANHERVPALLFIPAAATAAHSVPCLVLLHGLGGNKEQMAPLAEFAALFGYASLIIDEFGQGERAKNALAGSAQDALSVSLIGQSVRQTAIDVRRGMDYLAARPEIDSKRIGVVGISLGAIIGTVVAGVEPRIKATVLISGGGDWGLILKALAERGAVIGGRNLGTLKGSDWDQVETVLTPVDPLTFAAHIAPRPVLMECGRKDTIILPTSAEALYSAGEKGKGAHFKIDWYENAGHVPPFPQMLPAVQNWLALNL